jgi:hypothetical protein
MTGDSYLTSLYVDTGCAIQEYQALLFSDLLIKRSIGSKN